MQRDLSYGDSGTDVGQLHQDLLEAGESIDALELSQQNFGETTRAAVVDFQSHHTDPGGHPLAHDGRVGPLTQWSLKHPGGGLYKAHGWLYDSAKTNSLTLPVCQAAVGDLGLKENPDGSNDGPELKKFQTYGRPWCALAVSHWFSLAIVGSPFGVQPAVVGLLSWAKIHGKIVPADQAVLPGDVMIIIRGSGHGHTGLIVGVNADGMLSTVEGNCSNSVRGCVRDRHSLSAIIRPLA